MDNKRKSHEKFCRRMLMKAKPSIKVEHDESPSIVGEVVNFTTNLIARSEGGLINVENGTSTTLEMDQMMKMMRFC
jgi:hypothetical protein